MNHTFKFVKPDYGASIYVAFGDRPTPDVSVTEDAIPGFIIQNLEKYNVDPPLTGISKVFGELTYGNQHPDLILSSEKMMKRMVRCLKPGDCKPMMYGCNFGFSFMGAIWSHSENTGVDIDEGWVFVLNRNYPDNYRLNGCYNSVWGRERE